MSREPAYSHRQPFGTDRNRFVVPRSLPKHFEQRKNRKQGHPNTARSLCAPNSGTHPPFRTIPSPQAPAACSFGNTTKRRGRRYRLPDHPIHTPAETGRGCSIRAAHPSPIRPGGRSDNDAAGTEAGNRHSDPTDTTKADGASAAPADTPSVSVSQSPRQATQRISNWAVRIRRNIVSG